MFTVKLFVLFLFELVVRVLKSSDVLKCRLDVFQLLINGQSRWLYIRILKMWVTCIHFSLYLLSLLKKYKWVHIKNDIKVQYIFITKISTTWCEICEKDILKHLQSPLIISKNHSIFIVCCYVSNLFTIKE